MKTIKGYTDFINEAVQGQAQATVVPATTPAPVTEPATVPVTAPATKEGMTFPKGTFSNTEDTFVTFTKFENNVKTGATQPRTDGSYSVSISTDQKWKNTPFEIHCYVSKDGNKIETIWYMPSDASDYITEDKIKDWSPLLHYIMDNNK